MEWQPIETAPKDGRAVDIWVRDESMDGGGQRFTDMVYRKGSLGQSNDWDSVDGMLCISDCGYTPSDVTNWMPLPDPPK